MQNRWLFYAFAAHVKRHYFVVNIIYFAWEVEISFSFKFGVKGLEMWILMAEFTSVII